jgi:hypothetical protein
MASNPHEFYWWGYDTCRCEKCGLVVKDKVADKLSTEECPAQ